MNIEVVNETNFELLPICIQFNILYFTRIARAASSMLLLNTPALALCSQQDCSRCFLYALAQYSCSCAMLPAGLLALLPLCSCSILLLLRYAPSRIARAASSM
ncbi:MAG: hypothetical protein ACI9NN_001952, partial [Bacteroidia bacterium]